MYDLKKNKSMTLEVKLSYKQVQDVALGGPDLQTLGRVVTRPSL